MACNVFTLAKKQITANYGARYLLRGLPINCFKESLSHGTVPRLHGSLAATQTQDTNMEKSATTFHSRGSPLRPFPRVLLCPLNISKITIAKCNGCSLNLIISCSSVFFGSMGRGLFSMGKPASNRSAKFAPVQPHPVTKFWAGTPPGHPQ